MKRETRGGAAVVLRECVNESDMELMEYTTDMPCIQHVLSASEASSKSS